MLLGLLGIYPQYTALRTLLIGMGVLQGDWRSSHRRCKQQVYVLEPVVESLLQLLVQSVLTYIVLGPRDPDIPSSFHCPLGQAAPILGPFSFFRFPYHTKNIQYFFPGSLPHQKYSIVPSHFLTTLTKFLKRNTSPAFE